MIFTPFSPIPLDNETYAPDGDGHTASRYPVAVAAVAAALVARMAFQGILGDSMAYTLFMPAVLAAAAYGGFGPGLLALVLSSLVGNYFFQKPHGDFAIVNGAEGTRLALSLLAGLLICVMGGLLRSVRRRVTADAKELLRQSERFRASDESYRRMFETAYEGICCIDDRHRVIYVNGRIVDMLGYSIIGMVGHEISDFVFPEDRQRLKSMLDGRRQGGKEVFDFRLYRKDRSAIYCIFSSQSIFDREGNYRGSLNMITDITARHLLADHVNQLLDSLKTQVQSLHDLQRTALAGMPRSGGHVLDVPAADCTLEHAQQAIVRSVELTDQILISLGLGKTDPAQPGSRMSAAGGEKAQR